MATIADTMISPQAHDKLFAETTPSTRRSPQHLLVQLALMALLMLLASGQLPQPAPRTASHVIPALLVDGGGGSSSPTPTTNCGGGAGGPC